MNTRNLMIATSAYLAGGGIAALFAPAELLGALGAPASEPLPVLVQVLGALYFAFGIVNWMAKDNVIGGIYSRPLALGNWGHFFAGGISLAKHAAAHGFRAPLTIVLVVYATFALCFGYLAFGRGAVRTAGSGG